jgi:transposase
MVERKNRPSIDNRLFVKLWGECDTVTEVAEKLGVQKPYVFQKAAALRAVGVKLKRMTRENSRKIDVEELNQIHAEAFREKYGVDPVQVYEQVERKKLDRSSPEIESLIRRVVEEATA